MNILGYLITLANVQTLSGPGGPEDLSVQLGSLHTLASFLQSLTNYPRDAFKHGLYRSGDTGIYASKKVRDFVYKGVGDPNSEGLIVALDYKRKQSQPSKDLDTLVYMLHSDKIDDEDKKYIDQIVANIDKINRRKSRSVVSSKP